MTTVSGFCLSLLCFRLEVLINHLFLFEILGGVLNKSSRFSSELLFRMRFGKISCCPALGIVFVPSDFRGIEDKGAPRCV